MRYEDLFPSNYLTASDLNGSSGRYRIKHLSFEDFEDGSKPVLEFEDTDKMLVLNKTNGKTLREGFGDDVEKWFGQEIELYTQRIDFKGKRVDAIRVRHIPAPF